MHINPNFICFIYLGGTFKPPKIEKDLNFPLYQLVSNLHPTWILCTILHAYINLITLYYIHLPTTIFNRCNIRNAIVFQQVRAISTNEESSLILIRKIQIANSFSKIGVHLCKMSWCSFRWLTTISNSVA